jgi:hypothetical protein
MSEENRYGKVWSDEELDAIIADYFAMLGNELAGIKYVKSRHSTNLMERLGRSHRSVEFKHQNISAVLNELGLPWIRGYIPKANYQDAIFDGIDRFLAAHPAVLEPTKALQTKTISSEVFVDAPKPVLKEKLLPARLDRLIRKYDPVARDHQNRILGKAGEEFVVEVEKRRLIEANRNDLARLIRWVSLEDGDGAGYDVFSYDPSGNERLIEVKTTNGAARTPFFLSRNECSTAMERPIEWRIYRVHLFASQPQIFTIAPPLMDSLNLSPETWRASF